jgi:hypothetical protein
MSKYSIHEDFYWLGGSVSDVRSEWKSGYRLSPALFFQNRSQGGPYWIGEVIAPTVKKTVIWCCQSHSLTSDDQNFLKKLFLENFQVFGINADNELVEIERRVVQETELSNFQKALSKNAQTLSRDHALQILMTQNKNPDLFFVLDEYERQLLANPSHYYDNYKAHLKDMTLSQVIQALPIQFRLPRIVLLDISGQKDEEGEYTLKKEEPVDLTSLPLSALKELKVTHTHTPFIRCPRQIEKLSFEFCKGLDALDLSPLTSLEELKFVHCYDVRLVAPIPKTVRTLELDVHHNDLSMIPNAVEVLSLYYNDEGDEGLDELDFSHFTHLTDLTLVFLKNLTQIRALPPSIKNLTIDNCALLRGLPYLSESEYPDLHQVILNNCPYFSKEDPPYFPHQQKDPTRHVEVKTSEVVFIDWEGASRTAAGNFVSSLKIDSSTFKDPRCRHVVKMGIYQGPEQKLIPPTEYRLHVFSQFGLAEGKITVSVDDEKWEPVLSVTYKDRYTRKETESFAQEDYLIEIPACEQRSTVLLPHRFCHDLMRTIPPRAQLFRKKQTPQKPKVQYKIILPASRFSYHIRASVSKQKVADVQPEAPVLSPAIKERIVKTIAGTPWEKKLENIDQKEAPEKLKLCEELEDYCRSFDSKATEEKGGEPDTILRGFKKKAGPCHVRATALALFLQYLGFDADVIENDAHSYVEAFLNGIYVKIDLKGSPSIVIKPSEKPVFKVLEEKKEDPKAFYRKPVPMMPPAFERLFPIFSFTQSVPAGYNTKQAVAWLAQQSHVLLKLNELAEIRGMAKALIDEAIATDVPHFYLESEEGIRYYLELRTLQPNGCFVSSAGEGSLTHFLSASTGLLVINWGGFPKDALPKYQSVMDEEPSLDIVKVSKGIRVINLIPASHGGSGSFTSRATEVNWPEKLPKPAPCRLFSHPEDEEDFKPKDTDEVISLEGKPDFEAELTGGYVFGDGGAEFKATELSTDKERTVFHRSPLRNRDFQRRIMDLWMSNPYIQNGQVKKRPALNPVFTVTTRREAWPLALKEVTGYVEEKKDDIYFLSSRNLSGLFEDTVLDKNGIPQPAPGWLDKQNPTQRKIIVVMTDKETLTEQLAPSLKKFERYPKQSISWVHWLDCKPPARQPITELCLSTFKKPGAYLLVTEDPYFVSELLQACAVSPVLFEVLHLRVDASMVLQKPVITEGEDKKPVFVNHIQRFSKAILPGEDGGKTVLACGVLSEDLWRESEDLGLFNETPTLKFYGDPEPKKVTGQLIIVTRPLKFSTAMAQRYGRSYYLAEEFLHSAYRKSLARHPAYEKYGKKVFEFFRYVKEKIPHPYLGTPAAPYMSFNRLWRLLDLLADEEADDNLIKSVCLYSDYEKDTDIAAKINVQLKRLFGNRGGKEKPQVRWSKLKEYPKTPAHFWRRLNSLNAAAIQSLSALNEDGLEGFLKTITSKSAVKKEPDPYRKTEKRLAYHLMHRHAVFLKGPASGKPYFAHQYSKNVFEGEAELEEFLNHDSKEAAVWLQQEVNLRQRVSSASGEGGVKKEPGALDFLFPHILSRDKHGSSVITYREKTYTLNANFKIIVTGNKESDPDRFFDPFLQEIPVIILKTWSDATLMRRMIWPHYQAAGIVEDEEEKCLIMKIIPIYRWVEKTLTPEKVSLESLQRVIQRGLLLRKNGLSKEQAVGQALLSEWRYSFDEPEEGAEFQKKLREFFPRLDLEVLPPVSASFQEKLPPHFYLSSIQKRLLRQLHDDISLAQEEAAFVSRGSLLEGPSGFGKSTLFRALFHAMGYQEMTPAELLEAKTGDYSHCFVHFTLSQDVQTNLTLFEKGARCHVNMAVDELNFNQKIQDLLIRLLAGKSKFYLGASQNGVIAEGRASTPPALLSCLHTYFLPDYTDTDLQEIAAQALPEESEKLIQGLVQAYRRSPHKINARHFFKGLSACREKSVFIRHLFLEYVIASNDLTGVKKYLDKDVDHFLCIKALQCGAGDVYAWLRAQVPDAVLTAEEEWLLRPLLYRYLVDENLEAVKLFSTFKFSEGFIDFLREDNEFSAVILTQYLASDRAQEFLTVFPQFFKGRLPDVSGKNIYLVCESLICSTEEVQNVILKNWDSLREIEEIMCFISEKIVNYCGKKYFDSSRHCFLFLLKYVKNRILSDEIKNFLNRCCEFDLIARITSNQKMPERVWQFSREYPDIHLPLLTKVFSETLDVRQDKDYKEIVQFVFKLENYNDQEQYSIISKVMNYYSRQDKNRKSLTWALLNVANDMNWINLFFIQWLKSQVSRIDEEKLGCEFLSHSLKKGRFDDFDFFFERYTPILKRLKIADEKFIKESIKNLDLPLIAWLLRMRQGENNFKEMVTKIFEEFVTIGDNCFINERYSLIILKFFKEFAKWIKGSKIVLDSLILMLKNFPEKIRINFLLKLKLDAPSLFGLLLDKKMDHLYNDGKEINCKDFIYSCFFKNSGDEKWVFNQEEQKFFKYNQVIYRKYFEDSKSIDSTMDIDFQKFASRFYFLISATLQKKPQLFNQLYFSLPQKMRIETFGNDFDLFIGIIKARLWNVGVELIKTHYFSRFYEGSSFIYILIQLPGKTEFFKEVVKKIIKEKEVKEVGRVLTRIMEEAITWDDVEAIRILLNHRADLDLNRLLTGEINEKHAFLMRELLYWSITSYYSAIPADANHILIMIDQSIKNKEKALETLKKIQRLLLKSSPHFLTPPSCFYTSWFSSLGKLRSELQVNYNSASRTAFSKGYS